MIISDKELKKDLDKYLDLVKNEDITVTCDNVIVAKLSCAEEEKLDPLNKLIGITSGEPIDPDSIKKERLSRYMK